MYHYFTRIASARFRHITVIHCIPADHSSLLILQHTNKLLTFKHLICLSVKVKCKTHNKSTVCKMNHTKLQKSLTDDQGIVPSTMKSAPSCCSKSVQANSTCTDRHRQTATDMFVRFCQISVLPLSVSVAIGWCLNMQSAFGICWKV